MTLTLGAMAPKRRSNASGGIRGASISSFVVVLRPRCSDVVGLSKLKDLRDGISRISRPCNEAAEN
jgi:hypothetical protein